MRKNWKTMVAGGAVLTALTAALAVPALASTGRRTAVLDYNNITVTLDGRTLDLRDGRGNAVEPFVIDGTTYLPVAAVSQALGLEVSWDGESRTVELTRDRGTTGAGSAGTSGVITAERAREIALDHAGVSASKAVFVKTRLDREDGRQVYEVEFYAGNLEYDYELDAVSGKVLSVDQDAESYVPEITGNSGYISEAKAKSIVEDRAGASGTYREFKLDRDDGRAVYEGELRVGSLEYEFQLDAATGTILEWELDHR